MNCGQSPDSKVVLWQRANVRAQHRSPRFVGCALFPYHRLVETHPAGSPTVDGARELRPEWRAWVDRCLRYQPFSAVVERCVAANNF